MKNHRYIYTFLWHWFCVCIEREIYFAIPFHITIYGEKRRRTHTKHPWSAQLFRMINSFFSFFLFFIFFGFDSFGVFFFMIACFSSFAYYERKNERIEQISRKFRFFCFFFGVPNVVCACAGNVFCSFFCSLVLCLSSLLCIENVIFKYINVSSWQTYVE